MVVKVTFTLSTDAPSAAQSRRRIAALCLAGLLAACSGDGQDGASKAAPQTAEEAPVAVFTTRAGPREITDAILGTGTIAALRTTDVGPSIDGIIDEIFVRVGEQVKEGQPLFRTRTVEYDLRVKELKGRVALTKAELTNAKAELDRIEPLVPKGIVPPTRLDKARAAYDSAVASQSVARAQLEQAEQQLKDAVVTAPYDAVVTARNVDEGRFMATRMGGGGMMGGPSGVVQLMHIDIVAAIVRVAEVHLPKLRLGMPARVRIDGLDRSFDSVVHVINDFVDPGARTIEVRIAIENKDHAIKPGLFAMAEILPEPRTALALERGAVLGFGDERFVYVDAGGTARRVAVEVRELDADHVEIVAGLAEGTAVLKGPNLPRLRDGGPITVIEEVKSSGAEG